MNAPTTLWQARQIAAAADRSDKQAVKSLRDELIHKLHSDGVPVRIIAGVFDLTASRVLQIAKLWK